MISGDDRLIYSIHTTFDTDQATTSSSGASAQRGSRFSHAVAFSQEATVVVTSINNESMSYSNSSVTARVDQLVAETNELSMHVNKSNEGPTGADAVDSPAAKKKRQEEVEDKTRSAFCI